MFLPVNCKRVGFGSHDQQENNGAPTRPKKKMKDISFAWSISLANTNSIQKGNSLAFGKTFTSEYALSYVYNI